MFDALIDKYRPAAQEVGHQALCQVERIVARLDMIHDVLAREDDRAIRRIFKPTPAQNGFQLAFEVPATQLWEIEYINCYSATASLQFLTDTQTTGAPPIFSAQVPAGGTPFLNVGMFITGGTQVYAFGQGTNQMITIQVRVHSLQKPKNSAQQGIPELPTGGVPSPQAELEESDRHGQNNVTMLPTVIGERR